MHQFFNIYILDQKIQYGLLKKIKDFFKRRTKRISDTDLHIKALDWERSISFQCTRFKDGAVLLSILLINLIKAK